MFFLRPVFIHHNVILVDEVEDFDFLSPVIPQSRFRLLFAAPLFIHHNTIKKVSVANNDIHFVGEGKVYCKNKSGSSKFRMLLNSGDVQQANEALDQETARLIDQNVDDMTREAELMNGKVETDFNASGKGSVLEKDGR